MPMPFQPSPPLRGLVLYRSLSGFEITLLCLIGKLFEITNSTLEGGHQTSKRSSFYYILLTPSHSEEIQIPQRDILHFTKLNQKPEKWNVDIPFDNVIGVMQCNFPPLRGGGKLHYIAPLGGFEKFDNPLREVNRKFHTSKKKVFKDGTRRNMFQRSEKNNNPQNPPKVSPMK
eukprot:TRINITY_DN21993_c0_g1_i1.p1 TRINITY_DN21993_c0_g1~~TRINITY_DN21993_c0_g1_i1.p1  ORF type:complete len:173 (+),score=10.39 TRINITY_DN21993_c0_g1_i1:855-1373(+)